MALPHQLLIFEEGGHIFWQRLFVRSLAGHLVGALDVVLRLSLQPALKHLILFSLHVFLLLLPRTVETREFGVQLLC